MASDQPFACQHCDLKCASATELALHMQKLHTELFQRTKLVKRIGPRIPYVLSKWDRDFLRSLRITPED